MVGYSMGRDQSGAQVRAATGFFKKPEISVSHNTDVTSKRANNPAPATTPAGTAAPPNSDWEFYHAGDNKKPEDRLKPVAARPARAQKNVPVLVRTTAAPTKPRSSSKTPNTPPLPARPHTMQPA